MRHYLTLALACTVACGGAPFSEPSTDALMTGDDAGTSTLPDAGHELGDRVTLPDGAVITTSPDAGDPSTNDAGSTVRSDGGTEASDQDAGTSTNDAPGYIGPSVPWTTETCYYGAPTGQSPALDCGAAHYVVCQSGQTYQAYCSPDAVCHPSPLTPGNWACAVPSTSGACNLVTAELATWPANYLYECPGGRTP